MSFDRLLQRSLIILSGIWFFLPPLIFAGLLLYNQLELGIGIKVFQVLGLIGGYAFSYRLFKRYLTDDIDLYW